MWIYYYASFGPGHQSHDYGFKQFHDSYSMDDMEEYLLGHIDSCDYSVALKFWVVEKPPVDYVNNKITELKEEIRNFQIYLDKLKFQDSFVPEEEEGEDATIQKNIDHCIDMNLLQRLHRAGLMYTAEDIRDWDRGKKHPIEPHRNKVLRIMRRTEKYPSYK